jgi:hypothetical protein
VDGTPKTLSVAEVQSLHHYWVESGGEVSKGERGVHV